MRIVILIFFCWISTLVFGQSEVSFRQLSVIQGLSQNSAISITQDQDGFLWIATQDGLNRYDGTEFKKYPFQFEDVTKPTFSYLGKVIASNSGAMWVIPSNRGLYKYEVVKDTFIQITSKLSYSTLLPFKDQGLLIGTHGQGVWYEDFSKKIRRPIQDDRLKGSTIYGLHSGKNDECYVSGNGLAGLIYPETYRFVSFQNVNKIINYSSMAEDEQGEIWVGTYGAGLWKTSRDGFLLENISFIGNTFFSDDLNIEAVYCDRQNRIWVATYGDGLYMISGDRKQVSHFLHEKQNPRALHYNDLLSIYEDYSGTLWFGTDGGGVSYYDQYLQKFTPYLNSQLPDDVNIDVVRSIAQDQKFLWIGTSGKGLTRLRLSDGSWKTFTTDNLPGLTSNRIMSLFSDKNELWIGTQEGGLHIMDSQGICRSVGALYPDSAHTVWTIFKDSGERIWLGTRDRGLVEVGSKGQPLKTYDFKTITKTNQPVSIRAITEGGGYFWLATDFHGLIRWNPHTGAIKHFKPGTTQNTISNTQLKSLYYQNEANRLWVGTNGSGMDVFDLTTETFYHYSEKDGLANGVIYAILDDDNGSLWLSSNRGITRFEIPNLLSHSPTITNFTNYDGLATEFNTGAYYKASDGTLYFGSLEGFYAFQPNQITPNTIPPKTKITRFEVFNRAISMQKFQELKHHENTLTFHFSGLQFSLPQKNVYRYRLLPMEKEWNEAGSVTFARYTNLSPGAYEFQVSSGNYDGYWGDDFDRLSFQIHKAWYLSNALLVIYTLLFLVLIYVVYVYFKTSLDFKKKRIEAEQLQQLNQYKSKLFSELSHEIRTPLTLMKLPLDKQLQNLAHDRALKKDLEIIANSNKQLLELVDQLQDLAQIETGIQKLQVREGSLGLFLQTISDAFQYQTKAKQQVFESEIALSALCWYDEQILLKILNNLLINAVKYTPTGGKISFQATMFDTNYVKITVTNDLEHLIVSPERLFDRFYRESADVEGSGIGLALVKELVSFHRGDISVNEFQKTRLQFVLQLPVGRSFYALDELVEEKTFSAATHKKEDEKETLIIIEDHPELRQSLVSIFEPHYTILTAPNGFEGMKLIKRELPDLVISDVMMPLMDGFQLCHEVKSNEITSHIPVILLTAKADSISVLQGLNEGADAYIKKPFESSILEQQVNNILQTKRKLRENYQLSFQVEKMAEGVSDASSRVTEKLQQVVEQKILNSDFDTEAFSQFMGMSRMQLHRKIKSITGQTPHDFIKLHRITYAEQLLLTTDLQIAEIAFQSGFGSSSHFSKTYKALFGITPNEKRTLRKE